MTNNEFILCSTCKKCVNLRIQMGDFPVDFALNCPECKTEITGRVEFEPFGISLTNAQILDKDVPNYDKY